MAKRILYLSDMDCLAYQVNGNHLTCIQTFTPNAEQEFTQYLLDDLKTPIICLIDSVKEEYQMTSLPHVVGMDRQKLLARKMQRLFESSNYTYAMVQGRSQSGRGDDQILFTSLTQSTLLQPWLQLILTHKVPLAGIFSIPLLTHLLLKKLTSSNPYTLLVMLTPRIAEHSQYGLRQSFFSQHYLKMSRLSPLTIDSAPGEAIFDQIVKTQRYLENSRILPPLGPKNSLPILILTENSLKNQLETYPIEKLNSFSPVFLDIAEIAEQWKLLPTNIEQLFPYHLILYLLSKEWHLKNHYAKSVERRYFTYRKVRAILYLSALFSIGIGTLLSYQTFQLIQTVQQQGEQKRSKALQLIEETARLQGQVPNLPLDIVLIRNIVDTGLYLKSMTLSPEPILQKISAILVQHPNLQIQRLEWELKNDFLPPAAPPNLLLNKGFNKGNKGNMPVEKPGPPEFFLENLRLYGQISPFGGNYQNALYLFEQFANEVRKNSYFFQANTLLSPYDPKKALQGQIGSTTEVGTAPFTLEISVKHNYIKLSN